MLNKKGHHPDNLENLEHSDGFDIGNTAWGSLLSNIGGYPSRHSHPFLQVYCYLIVWRMDNTVWDTLGNTPVTSLEREKNNRSRCDLRRSH